MCSWKEFLSLQFFALLVGHMVWAEPPIRVLSLDGGGIKGIIEAVILNHIELELNKPISQVFDLVAGSSIGGIIALGLSTPSKSGQPRFSAKDMIDIYTKHGSKIFHTSLFHKLRTAGGLWGPKYESHSLRKLLNYYLADAKLSEALVPTLITGYHVDGEIGVEFFSEKARSFPAEMDCLMRDVALATAAAPVLFDTPNIEFDWGTLHAVADGGIYKNNPVMLAYISAKQMYPNRKIEVYSLGTGKTHAEVASRSLGGRGLLQWLSPIIYHVQIGDSEGDNAILHRLLNENGEENFFRLDICLDRNHRSIDDASKKNVQYLYQKGIEATQTDIFKRMLARLRS